MLTASKVRWFLWYWLPTLVYCIFIFALSSFSKPFLTPSFSGADKVFHGIEYAIFGLLLARSVYHTNLRLTFRSLALVVMALAILYGISDEIHQVFVCGRIASSWDVLADGLGSLLGVLCYIRISRTHHKPR